MPYHNIYDLSKGGGRLVLQWRWAMSNPWATSNWTTLKTCREWFIGLDSPGSGLWISQEQHLTSLHSLLLLSAAASIFFFRKQWTSPWMDH